MQSYFLSGPGLDQPSMMPQGQTAQIQGCTRPCLLSLMDKSDTEKQNVDAVRLISEKWHSKIK